jgi:hypothetical protein
MAADFFNPDTLWDSNFEIHWSAGGQLEQHSGLYSSTRVTLDVPDAAMIFSPCACATERLKKQTIKTITCNGLLRITPLSHVLESQEGKKLQLPEIINPYSRDFEPEVDAGCLAPLP